MTQNEIDKLQKGINYAYYERSQLVAALSKLFPAFLERHPKSDTAWQDDWRWIVVIDLPTGQACWHIHDSDLHDFNHLCRKDENFYSWDGHTYEDTYKRLAALSVKTV